MAEMDAAIPPHFLVIVPGMMGSKLRDRRTGEMVWLDFDSFPTNPLRWDDWIENTLEQLKYPNDDLEPAGIMDRVMFMSPWAKQEQYDLLLDALCEMGYTVDAPLPEGERHVHTFSYDWRQDIRTTGRQLGEAIERWHVLHDGAPAWVMGHSMGGIAARWYIENEGGKDYVERLFLMASPWNGAPKALQMLFGGMDLFMRSRFNPLKVRQLTREAIRSFPSSYQILPHQGFYLRDGQGRHFDPYAMNAWLENDEQRALLADGKRFNEELGNTLSVETLCFFGRKRPTFAEGLASIDPAGTWLEVAWQSAPNGDGTVLETSAVHDAALIKLPFVSNHGNICWNPGVLEVLQWELKDKWLARPGATRPEPPPFRIMTEVEEQYLPGAVVKIHTLVDGDFSHAALAALYREDAPGMSEDEAREALEAVQDGRIHVQLAWQSGLPGNPPLPEIPDVVVGVLKADTAPGEFVGELEAPLAEGYYRLLTEAWIDGVRVIDRDLLVIDDGQPGWGSGSPAPRGSAVEAGTAGRR